jgi:hypothetical protein
MLNSIVIRIIQWVVVRQRPMTFSLTDSAATQRMELGKWNHIQLSSRKTTEGGSAVGQRLRLLVILKNLSTLLSQTDCFVNKQKGSIE